MLDRSSCCQYKTIQLYPEPAITFSAMKSCYCWSYIYVLWYTISNKPSIPQSNPGGVILCLCESGFAATVLQKAQVRIINHSVCDKLMSGQLTSRMLCAGVLSGGVDACQVIWFFQREKVEIMTHTPCPHVVSLC